MEKKATELLPTKYREGYVVVIYYFFANFCSCTRYSPWWIKSIGTFGPLARRLPHLFNPFLANVFILYNLKTPEKLWLSGVFRGYEMGTLDRNWLMIKIKKCSKEHMSFTLKCCALIKRTHFLLTRKSSFHKQRSKVGDYNHHFTEFLSWTMRKQKLKLSLMSGEAGWVAYNTRKYIILLQCYGP